MDYLNTLKPKIVALFLVSAWVAWTLASGRLFAFPLVFTLAGLAFCVAGASALNNYLERDRDRLMLRTHRRALPAGRVLPGRIRTLAVALLLSGVVILWFAGGPLAACFGALGAAHYLIAYTLLLKPRTAYSAVPGGLAGIFPPLVGWASAGGGLSAEIVFLCGIVFLWSPPHFWALTLARAEDYRCAGIPVPGSHCGVAVARLQIVAYTSALVSLSLLPGVLGFAGLAYLLTVLTGGVLFGGAVLALALTRQAHWNTVVYRLSGPYLGLLLLALALGADGTANAQEVLVRAAG